MDIDMKKLETAIIYLQRIAEGNNPINNMPAEDDAVLNNPNVIRCMFYVRDVLKAVRDNGGIGNAKVSKELKIRDFPYEVLPLFTYREDKGVSKFIEQIYEPVESGHYKKLSGKKVNDWMVAQGYLVENLVQDLNKHFKFPTEKGKAIGLRTEKVVRTVATQSFYQVIYSKQAQELVIENMERIVNS